MIKLPVTDRVVLPASPPVNKASVTVGAPQLNVVFEGTVPLIPLVGVTANAPLQIAVLMAEITGLGSMLASKIKLEPTQKLVAGVTVYRT